ncbi:MAG: hypothetical protein LBJ16_01360 [Holosporaceae bacterium]|nr:hypothetical protein [Holosporaceae bacterium]
MRSFGNFCVASVLGSSCTTCTLRSCAPYAPINSSKYLCFERSLILLSFPAIFKSGIPDIHMIGHRTNPIKGKIHTLNLSENIIPNSVSMLKYRKFMMAIRAAAARIVAHSCFRRLYWKFHTSNGFVFFAINGAVNANTNNPPSKSMAFVYSAYSLEVKQ